MSEWYYDQKKLSGKFRQFLQERTEKSNQRCKLTAEKTKRLNKFKTIGCNLKREENVQNRQLQTWLSEDEYSQIETEWQEYLALREKLKDKPSELKHYNEKLEKVMLNNNCTECHLK